MEIRPFRSDEGMVIKQVRLRSLADAPYAFGVHAYEEESALPDSYWHNLAAQVGGSVSEWRDKCVSFVLLDSSRACGAVTCYLCPQVSGRAYVTAAWIETNHRRHGYGRRLIEEAVAWAASRGASHLRLWVDDTNPAAVEFYLAIGFVPTGESQPISPGSTDCQRSLERRLVGRVP